MAFIQRMRGSLAHPTFIVWTSTDPTDVATSPTLTSGSGVPTSVQPQGSIYQRINGDSGRSSVYVNTDGSTTWEALGGADFSSGLTVSGGAIDLDPTGAVSLDMDAAQTITFTAADNLASAFKLRVATDDYLDLDSQNGTETLSFGNSTTNPLYQFLGTGDVVVNGEIRNSRFAQAAIAVTDATGGSTDATVDVDIQNLAGQNLGVAKAIRVRFYDASRNVLDGTASTLTLAATTGTIVDEPGSGDSWAECLTDATGNLTLTVTNSADATIYCTVEASGNAASGGQGVVIVESVEQTITWSA